MVDFYLLQAKKYMTRIWEYENTRDEENKNFRCHDNFGHKLFQKHIINDHNNIYHDFPLIKETWVTHRWPNRVFYFLLMASKLNSYLYIKHWE